jgi:hypothetical protein
LFLSNEGKGARIVCFQDDKLIVKEKSRPTDNITAKATFYPNGWNP